MAVTGSVWSPSSWRSYPALHQPEWPSEERAEAVRGKLATVPPLVFAGEARQLRAALAEVADGRAFLLQAGDCAESFNDISAIHIREKLKILLQMAAVLTYGATLPVVKVGRIAGSVRQGAGDATEPGGTGIPSFRGHMIHDDAPRRRLARIRAHVATTTTPRRRSTCPRVHEGRFAGLCACTSGTRGSSPRPSRPPVRAARRPEIERFLRGGVRIDVVAEQAHQVDV
jgi:hypothetical protein